MMHFLQHFTSLGIVEYRLWIRGAPSRNEFRNFIEVEGQQYSRGQVLQSLSYESELGKAVPVDLPFRTRIRKQPYDHLIHGYSRSFHARLLMQGPFIVETSNIICRWAGKIINI
jgi:hypothetical protein